MESHNASLSKVNVPREKNDSRPCQPRAQPYLLLHVGVAELAALVAHDVGGLGVQLAAGRVVGIGGTGGWIRKVLRYFQTSVKICGFHSFFNISIST